LAKGNSLAKKAGESWPGQLLKGTKGYSHADMINLMGEAYAKVGEVGPNALADIATGAFFGMDMALPTQWRSSSYTSSLTVFIKLVSPVGTEACIKKNILEPLLYLIAASSPITYGGIMYGFPLLWDIQAQGITNFRLGGIAAMSLIRGSFETTFNKTLQPTVIDVRLTIIPVLNEFASQVKADGQPEIYKTPDTLGVANPSDIDRGLMNKTQLSPASKTEILSIKL
jgi:hypothetical protein